MDGVMQSTFECFFDERCLRKLSEVLQISFTQRYRNASAYSPNQTLAVILGQQYDKLFYAGSNYDAYFRICAPSSCSYSYVQENDALYVFTTLLGLYGGLTAALKFIVWYSLYMNRVAWRRCRRTIEPIASSHT